MLESEVQSACGPLDHVLERSRPIGDRLHCGTPIPYQHPIRIEDGLTTVAYIEQMKEDKNGPHCAMAGVAFEPFGISTFGWFRESHESLFTDVVAILPETTSKYEKDAISRRCSQQRPLALKRDIVRMLLQWSDVYTSTGPRAHWKSLQSRSPLERQWWLTFIQSSHPLTSQ